MGKKAALALIAVILGSLMLLGAPSIKGQQVPPNIGIPADSSTDLTDLTAKQLAPKFLSEVVGLDLTKYNMTKVGYGCDYPSYFGGEVKEEVVSFELISRWGSINDLSAGYTFCNDHLYSFSLYQGIGSMIELKEPTTDPVNASRNMLQRYKAFAEKLGWNASHIDQASEMLNNVSPDPSGNHSRMFSDIVWFVPAVVIEGNMKLVVKEDRVDWIYTEGGWDMAWKCLSIGFGSDMLDFVDTWNLFKVGSLSAISEDEAKSIGWAAARNYNLTLTYKNGTEVPETAKWSNVSEISFSMVLGQYHKMDPDSDVNSGSVNREPLSLYPLWQMKFNFGKGIIRPVGIQVSVWGDTKEIAQINLLYGHLSLLGDPDTSSPELQPESLANPTPPPTDNTEINQSTTSTEPSPEATQFWNPSQPESGNPSMNLFLLGGAAAVAAAVAVARVVRNQKVQIKSKPH